MRAPPVRLYFRQWHKVYCTYVFARARRQKKTSLVVVADIIKMAPTRLALQPSPFLLAVLPIFIGARRLCVFSLSLAALPLLFSDAATS